MATVLAPSPIRARQPVEVGVAERDGGRIAYEVFGAGEPPIMFVPPWQIVHSRVWKLQIAEFARRHRVIAWDARGNGRSDRPRDPMVHTDWAIAADLTAVLDATATGPVVLVGLSGSVAPSIIVATDQPERVLGLVLIAPSVPLGERNPDRNVSFDEPVDGDVDARQGWATQNIHVWRRDFRRFLEYFFSQAFPEAHSTKPFDDAVGYGLETDPETLGSTMYATGVERPELLERCRRIRCPTLIIQGDDERISHVTRGIELARAIPGARLEMLEGSGHLPNVRDPVRVNLLIRGFLGRTVTAT
jgi:pimeloyl-ACP methyl ester carboxylesterase